MTTQPPMLQLVDESEVEPSAAAEPKVFVRSITAPPGLPWDQVSAAGIEARMGAPLPLADVKYRLRRLEPWRPSRPARFAAFYVRAQEAGPDFATVVEVEGRKVPISFLSPAEKRKQAQRSAVVAGVAVAIALMVGMSLVGAWGTRRGAAAKLDALELQVARLEKQALVGEQAADQARALTEAAVLGRRASDFLADLHWARQAKAPGARLEALHWRPEAMAVEARGETAPFEAAGRRVERGEAQIRPGVWLWGIAGP